MSIRGFITERYLEYSPKRGGASRWGGGAWKRAIFSNNFLFLDFPPEEDILRKKYIRLKIFSIKFSTKKILIVEAVKAMVDTIRAPEKGQAEF